MPVPDEIGPDAVRAPRECGYVTADAVTAAYDAGVLTVRAAGAHAGNDTRQISVTTGSRAIEPGEQPAA